MSYRYAAHFLAELFPLAGKAHPEQIRRATLAVAAITHSAPDVVESSQQIDLGLDTTFLRSNALTKGHRHEVLIGHGQNGSGKRQIIGTLLTNGSHSSKRVCTCLDSLGRTPVTNISAFTDGAKGLRTLLRCCAIAETPILDWEHIARKLENLQIIARSCRVHFGRARGICNRILQMLDRINWRLWHGQNERSQASKSDQRLRARIPSSHN
jgi:hypothetical protein